MLIPTGMGEEPFIPQMQETPEEKEQRLEWFRDAGFGLFVHWGPAALSGEEISWGMAGRIEGGAQHMKVPRETYMNLYRDFNPVKFDADALLGLAKNAGMNYVVFVTKHHDGFSLWPTREKRFPKGAEYPEHYSIADTPYQKDPVRMVQQAAKKHGLRLGWYYSTRDWTHPDYLQGDNQLYNTYYENQVEELLQEYGPVDLLWFDHTFGKWSQYTIPRLYQKMYAFNPQLLVNNRAARGLKDVPLEWKPLSEGDFNTPENRMGLFEHESAWESCMILSPHIDHGGWSYRPDARTRSLTETLQLLSSCVTGDGNMLLNLAPLPDGSIRPAEQAILEGIASWMPRNGEAIHGTRGGPWMNGRWGGASYRGRDVYVHIFQPGDAALVLRNLPQTILSASTMDGTAVPFEQDMETGSLSLSVPAEARDPHVTIVKIELDAEVNEVLYGPAQLEQAMEEVPGTLVFHPQDAVVSGALRVEGEGEDGVLVNWIHPEDHARWPLEIESPGSYTVEVSTSAATPGAVIEARCGKQKTTAFVPVTGDQASFQRYALGRVSFPNAERLELKLGAVRRDSWVPVEVKEIRLIPSN